MIKQLDGRVSLENDINLNAFAIVSLKIEHKSSFHFISFHFIAFTSFQFISIHFISIHFNSFHFISIHFNLFHCLHFLITHKPGIEYSEVSYLELFSV